MSKRFRGGKGGDWKIIRLIGKDKDQNKSKVKIRLISEMTSEELGQILLTMDGLGKLVKQEALDELLKRNGIELLRERGI